MFMAAPRPPFFVTGSLDSFWHPSIQIGTDSHGQQVLHLFPMSRDTEK